MATTLGVLIFDDEPPVTVGGLTLTERAVLLAHRAELSPIVIWGPGPFDPESDRRLRARGIAIIQRRGSPAPLEGTADHEALVIIGPNVLFEQAVLNDLCEIGRDDDDTPTMVCDSGAPLLLFLPRGATADVRTCQSLSTIVERLASRRPVRELPLAGAFRHHASDAKLASSMERAFISHLNGGTNESFFTKQIRRFSMPLTSRLVRLGARPTQVTLSGLALATASAWCLARGSYGAGVLGGVLYYASMVLDCSDGEVARLTVRDSAAGAWLETMVDYATYFLLLAGLTLAVRDDPDANLYRAIAGVAFAASLLVAFVAGYLRHRVAATDPGQFDEASARVMGSATRFQRAASWSRQWIKRSTIAHLVLVLALVNQLPILLYLWAFGATLAAIVFVAVEPFVVKRVMVAHQHVRPHETSGQTGV